MHNLPGRHRPFTILRSFLDHAKAPASYSRITGCTFATLCKWPYRNEREVKGLQKSNLKSLQQYYKGMKYSLNIKKHILVLTKYPL